MKDSVVSYKPVRKRLILQLSRDRILSVSSGAAFCLTDASPLFSEFAETLLCFTERLYHALLEESADQVFFLSREGQPLMRAFELYQLCVGGKIIPRYLEVSRRSTVLPSLSSLECESFDTLFRQYREISLYEFLASLGLDSYVSELSELIGVSGADISTRLHDFPTSGVFLRLLESSRFQTIYEAERMARKDAFLAYLSSISGGEIPKRMVIVDVGWKGTIQDNLHSLLCLGEGASVRSLMGYYVGLIGAGSVREGNEKKGLLFSSVGRRSPYFHVFNENRALFEILLAADHGSIKSYEINELGKAVPICGDFDERDMIKKYVLPVQGFIFDRFEYISSLRASHEISLRSVALTHSRMVFSPTKQELDWFDSVFHVENYGVFERSEFKSSRTGLALWGRVFFLLGAIGCRGRGVLGFWPWKTLRETVGATAALLYSFIRRMQR